MMQKCCSILLRLLGWTSHGTVVPEKKCIIIGVPHTSALDFVISWMFYKGMGGQANILIKKEFFFWPVGWFVRKMGGLPIDRSRGANVVRQTIQLFNQAETLHLAIAPEGTRKRTTKWKAGFHTIARAANVPVYLGCFDWGRKQMSIFEKFELTDDPQADIRRMKDYYREKGVRGRNPEEFTTDY